MSKVIFITVGTTEFDLLLEQIDCEFVYKLFVLYGFSKIIV